MSRAVLLAIFLVGALVISTSSTAWAAQLEARINPNTESSDFKINYQKTIFIEYPDGGELFDELRLKEWTVSGTADSSNPGVQDLISKLNSKILKLTDNSKSLVLAITHIENEAIKKLKDANRKTE